jgi:hypothetical protein
MTTTQWIAEPQTVQEVTLELLTLEQEIEERLEQYRALQVEICEMDGDRLHLKRLLTELVEAEMQQCAG